MESGRKLVIFPTDQFYAIVGTITMELMAAGPYNLSLTDICNEQSSATHHARDHLHRPGRLYLTGTDFYPLRDHTRKACTTLTSVHLALKDIRGVIDYHPDRFAGNERKRREQAERKSVRGDVRFLLHEHVFTGTAEESDIYRSSEKFLGLSRLRLEEYPRQGFSLPPFLEMIGCPEPDYMAVNMSNVFHS